MAIKFFVQEVGTYVAYGLSSDTKPLSPPDGSLFIETDTSKLYKVSVGAWVEGLNTSYGTQGNLDLKAPLASPTFTGTVSGITKTMVGLSNVDNTTDAGKPVSTAQQTALDLKGNITSQTFVTPNIGVATATSVNKLTLTQPATTATLTIIEGKTFTASNTITLTATDGSTLAIGTGGTLGTAAYTASTAYDVAGAAAAVTPTSLGLVIGTNVQAYDADLTTWAGITPGTGVGTALAVNVGSAGAFVTFNGAGGTPSSLTGTNISGTAANLTAGNVTTNANLTGHITSTGNATLLGSFTVAQLNTALSDGDVATGGGTATGTNTGDQTLPTDATIVTTDVTTNNASTTKHGWMPKGTGSTSTFFRSDMTQAAPTASVAITETEIDVGTTPVVEASISVTDAGISTSSKIIGGVAYKAPTGKDLDELEMDALEIKFEPLTGTMNVHIKGLEGYIADKFILWYTFA